MPTDFVYDGTSLPTGKANFKPLNVPASKAITAEEWNTLTSAVADLRDAVLSGDYHGLANVLADVSGSLGVRLRNNAGRLQVSENGGIYRTVGGAELNAKDYGVVGDGTTNDTTALQAAITAAQTLKRPLRLAAGVYKINSGLTISAAVTILGTPRDGGSTGTVLRAGASLAHMLLIQGGSFSHISGIELDGNRLATVCMRLTSCSLSVFERCRFMNALRDGVRLTRYLIDEATFSLSDGNHFLNCDGYRCGTLYATTTLASAFSGLNVPTTAVSGTVSCTNGSSVVTGVGTSFTSLGLRKGDFIRVGSGGSPQYLQIHTVDSDTQITCGSKGPASASLSGQEYMIGAGCGYFEEFAPDTNINHITGGIWRSCAAAAVQIGGLYGALVESAQFDTCPFYGVAVNFSASSEQTYSTALVKCYFEGCEAAPIYLGAAYGISIVQPMVEGVATPIHYSSTTFSQGTWLDAGGLAAIGGGTNRMPSTLGSNFYNRGVLRIGSYYALSSAPASTQVDPSGGVFGLLSPNDGAAATLSATPVINGGTDGNVLTLYNATNYDLTLESEAARAGSKLYLRSYKLVLAPTETVTLVYYDNLAGWVEVNRGVSRGWSDATGTPGAATQNVSKGRSAIAAGASSVTITNNRVTTTSVVHATLQTADATLTQILNVIPGSGSFTVNANGNATSAVNIGWSVENR